MCLNVKVILKFNSYFLKKCAHYINVRQKSLDNGVDFYYNKYVCA